MRALPQDSSLHIANSAPIRMAQLYGLDPSIDVFSNRGVNGIDGCLSTAIGYAAATGRPTFVMIGDLAFFYDMNSLWIRDVPDNLRILLLNNEGGAVMHIPLPGDYSSTVAGRHVSAEHAMSARGWVESLGIEYSAARTAESTAGGIAWLADLDEHGPRVLEVFTEKLADIAQLKAYYSTLVEWRSRAERIPTDPASRRQDPATARPAVVAGASRAAGQKKMSGVGALARRVLTRLRRRLTKVEMARPYVVRVDPSPELHGMLAVVTGGSGAIGRAISLRLALSGAEVHVLGRSTARLDAVVGEIREHGGTAHARRSTSRTTRPWQGSSPPSRQWTSS